MAKCPVCKKENDDNWPIEVKTEDGMFEIRSGGCQDCWEEQCDKKWWKEVILMGEGLP
mgnify:FL=1